MAKPTKKIRQQKIKFKETHLVQESRTQLAVDFLTHEFSKLFPFCDRNEIRGKLTKMKLDANSDNVDIRNFWNLFTAVSGGLMLKELVVVVTAENFTWEREQVPISQTKAETQLSLPDEIRDVTGKEAIMYYKIHDKEREEELERSNNYNESRHKANREDPLIGTREQGNIVIIKDGNRRRLFKIVQIADNPNLDEEVLIWVGSGEGEPQNFWVLTGSMLDMRNFFPEEDLYEILRRRSLIAASEFAERVNRRESCSQ